eukprot:2620343-Amphidinium_carterae.2
MCIPPLTACYILEATPCWILRNGFVSGRVAAGTTEIIAWLVLPSSNLEAASTLVLVAREKCTSIHRRRVPNTRLDTRQEDWKTFGKLPNEALQHKRFQLGI